MFRSTEPHQPSYCWALTRTHVIFFGDTVAILPQGAYCVSYQNTPLSLSDPCVSSEGPA